MTVPTIKEYGCVMCQDWHTEVDPLWGPHILFQDKNGCFNRPMTPAEIQMGRLMEADQAEERGEWQESAWLRLVGKGPCFIENHVVLARARPDFLEIRQAHGSGFRWFRGVGWKDVAPSGRFLAEVLRLVAIAIEETR